MSEIIQVQDEYYILASSVYSDDRKWVLKEGDTFSVWDRYGDIRPIGMGEQGIYHEGTRFLSRSELRIAGRRPLLLSSDVSEDNVLFTVDLTNPDFPAADGLVERGALHLFRSKFFWKGVCYEKLKIWNLGLAPVATEIVMLLDADFADIFEVRGARRARRGARRENEPVAAGLVLSYEGLDRLLRRTRIESSPKPASVGASELHFDVSLPPKGQATYLITLSFESDGALPRPLLFDQAFEEAEELQRNAGGQYARVESTHEVFNRWIGRSLADVQMMVTATPSGPYPYAGVPWFSVPFGRDGIWTALECLWLNPDIARGVLSYLAAAQARETDAERDAEPGKILHETRKGEMASLNEIPFGRYYGSVDSTPLFAFLAGAYYERTGDRAFLETLWPSLESAMTWIDRNGDSDGDGYVDYVRRSRHGLRHQGWKDSEDSVAHADGTLAEAPVALCEVQAYVYAAKKKLASVAAALGRDAQSRIWAGQAEDLRARFERDFWCEELSTYALARDGQGQLCRVRSSNAGHCLFAGIASQERAARLSDSLLSQDSFSGWGIRTLASSEARYNPMSYHNGSVWPHDNAVISYGFAQYRLKDACLRVMEALFDATSYFPLARLPELFCGFARRKGSGPTHYPVACSPQAWAAAAPFLLLQSCLGLSIDGAEGRITFLNPSLPSFLPELRLFNLRIGGDFVDLHLQRHLKEVRVSVIRCQGDIEVDVQTS